MNALRTLIVEDDAMIAGLLAETLEGHCQSKFYTACSRTRAGWSSTVFARELPPARPNSTPKLDYTHLP
jgi:hypothetical protein